MPEERSTPLQEQLAQLRREHLLDAATRVFAEKSFHSTPTEVGRSAQAAADVLAALLDSLGIAQVVPIGISAAGPTALAFAQRHPQRTRAVVLESVVTLCWDQTIRRLSALGFGPLEQLTWGAVRLRPQVSPQAMMKAMLSELTTLDPSAVLGRMNASDVAFFKGLLLSMRSGSGFLHDLTHHVDDLHAIRAPLLAIFSHNDKSVPPANAQRVAREVASCQLYETPADTHLIWIGRHAGLVWERRLAFLQEHL